MGQGPPVDAPLCREGCVGPNACVLVAGHYPGTPHMTSHVDDEGVLVFEAIET